MVLTLYKYHIEYSIWQQALHCRLWNIFFWEGGTNFFILLERYWDSSHDAQGKYHPWPSVKEGVTLKQGEDGGGPRGRTKWVDLWNVMPPSSLEFHYCQRHIAFHFASIIHEIHIFFHNLIRRVAKPYKILSQRPMLISIINSLIAPKVWWFSVLWWGPRKDSVMG